MENKISKYVFNETKQEIMLKKVKEIEVRNSDIFLLGHAKSGTTWAQEMIWLILNDLDYEGAKVFIDERVPIIEISGYGCSDSNELINPECHWNSIEFVKKMKDRRCIKSHLKWEHLPAEILNETKTPKIIYIARNPKDVCLSAYCFLKNMINYIDCTFEEYCDYFLSGHYERYDNYWNNILYFWERRNNPNILFIKYEDMKHNLANIIRKVAAFLEKELTDEDELTLVKWLDFESMKNNPAVNHDSLYKKTGFMRVGKDGEYKKAMSTKIIEKFDTWFEENLKDSDYVL